MFQRLKFNCQSLPVFLSYSIITRRLCKRHSAMGFTLPSPTSPAEQVRLLMVRKENVESELNTHMNILTSNNSTLNSPLVDQQGFPRDDIDVYAVRNARVRIIELRNDLKGLMDEIGEALTFVYDPTLRAANPADTTGTSRGFGGSRTPFAKVGGVAPSSPAADSGLQREDLIVKFGALTQESFSASSLQPLADLVSAHENRSIPIEILRSDQTIHLRLTPRQGWGGRGMLGCHVVPYSPT